MGYSLMERDDKKKKSSGVAKAGLTLGIIGTSLAALGGFNNGGCGWQQQRYPRKSVWW